MFFVASKLFALLASPLFLVVLGTVATALLAWTRRRRAVRAVALLTAVAATGMTLLPVGAWLLAPLESQFPEPDLDKISVDGIIVLGGAIDTARSAATGRTVLTGEAERMTTFLSLARRFPHARLAFTGGTASLLDPDTREADFVPGFIAAQGVDPARTVIERESRNTHENAVLSLAAVRPAPGERWLLVTSAWHMPRAVGCFRAAGWAVTAYPTGGRSMAGGLDGWSPLRNLNLFSLALREWIGLFAYRMQGYTESLIPAAI